MNAVARRWAPMSDSPGQMQIPGQNSGPRYSLVRTSHSAGNAFVASASDR